MIKDKVSEDANIIWGAVIDDKMNDEMSVTVIATGFGGPDQKPAEAPVDNVIVDTPIVATPSSRATKDTTDDEDDTFYDIMSIFNK